MNDLPAWNIPSDLREQIDSDPDGIWEDDRFEPILLTVMAGTTYAGRDIALVWQIELEPIDDRDGNEWAELIAEAFLSRFPGFVYELHNDSESATCVLWVESEQACRHLIQVAWSCLDEIE